MFWNDRSRSVADDALVHLPFLLVAHSNMPFFLLESNRRLQVRKKDNRITLCCPYNIEDAVKVLIMSKSTDQQENLTVKRAEVKTWLTYETMSPLGRTLMEIAQQIEDSDDPALDEEEIEREIQRRRGGHTDRPRALDEDKGKVWIADDFDSLPDDVLSSFEDPL